jgi:hypothetical protein
VAICVTDAANTSRPRPQKTIAPMHITHGSPEVERGATQDRAAVIGEATANRHDLAMGGRIIVGFAEIVPARDHFIAARDHATKRIIALARLIERQAHKALVRGRGLGLR